MASEKEEKDIDDSLSLWQKLKAGFSGDASAQMAQKRKYKYQNDAELSNQNASPEQEAIRRRMRMGQ